MNKEIFFYFLLTHLVGDYVFQNGYIAKYKNSKLKVLILHVCIIFLSMIILMYPSSLKINNLIVIITLTIIHFAIDTIKFKNRTKKVFNTHTYYIIDQVMHFSSLLMASFFYETDHFLISQQYVKLIAVGLFNAYFVSLLFYMIDGFSKPYTRDYLGYFFRFSLPFIKYYGDMYFLIASIIFITFSIVIFLRNNTENIKSESGPLALSIIITYLSIWR
ncbi:hypothetical protein XO10_00335 [Marinitoga sp. 1135]|uniref:DUF3307 domain-containing protein n=1 Tax=Marinitoga piezophila (strain DSM 14283 / JCM 11233 / KA3) TaxID=443254 RepID=H2J2T1_MARPK|nr:MULTISPECIES: DUF3307 domain-containing protein [Marinitoga]AEX84525.1 Protein of unknown function (DUF3307) [Marinitoga piezophila KA3]APT75016.1 hypothetical protein LN42_00335 [Marinitoga sp. 1137]NUU94772.1 hypothetical protein [Marinitoga sp. 1135]NUU96701.1 hypothetical protein [Marinitoga sp. 1138]